MLLCFFYDFNQSPPLGLAEGAGLHDADLVAFVAFVLLILGYELVRPGDELAIKGMLLAGLDGDDDGLVILVADDHADSFLAKISFHMGVSLFLFFFFLGEDGDHPGDILAALLDLGGILQGRDGVIHLHRFEVLPLNNDAVLEVGDGHFANFSRFHSLDALTLFNIIPAHDELRGNGKLVGCEPHGLFRNLQGVSQFLFPLEIL